MARAPYFVRLCAIAAMLHTGACSKDAVPIFEKYCPEHGLKEDLQQFCERWWGRCTNCPPGKCPLHDPQRKGRPISLTKEKLDKAVKMFGDGYYSNGKKKHFHTVEEVRCARHEARPSTPMPPVTCTEPRACSAPTSTSPTHHACRLYIKGPSSWTY